MLQITPTSIISNNIPFSALMTWPDTTEVPLAFQNNSGQVIPIIQSALVVIPDDLDADAVKSELTQKDGPVWVNVYLPHSGTNTEVLVYQAFDYPKEDGKGGIVKDSEGNTIYNVILFCMDSSNAADHSRLTQTLWKRE